MAVQDLGRATALEMLGPLSSLSTKEKEAALAKMLSGEMGFYENPGLDESYSPEPAPKGGPLMPGVLPQPKPKKEEEPKVYLGPERPAPRHDISIKMLPKFNPDNNRNTGYGPKGNIFPSNQAQREEYDRMYGGTGSENAATMQAYRDAGQEGLVARRARERYENSPAGRKPTHRTSYDSFSEFFGK
jgi:hypothetical protein